MQKRQVNNAWKNTSFSNTIHWREHVQINSRKCSRNTKYKTETAFQHLVFMYMNVTLKVCQEIQFRFNKSKK